MNSCSTPSNVGFSARSAGNFKGCAVTLLPEGGGDLNPGRIVNVNVLPPFETTGIDSATSGTRWAPAGAGPSGYLSRLAHVVSSSGMKNPRFGSIVPTSVPGTSTPSVNGGRASAFWL